MGWILYASVLPLAFVLIYSDKVKSLKGECVQLGKNDRPGMIIPHEFDPKLVGETRTFLFRPKVDVIWLISVKVCYFLILSKSKLFSRATKDWPVYWICESDPNLFWPEIDAIWLLNMENYYFSILSKSKLFSRATQDWLVYLICESDPICFLAL